MSSAIASTEVGGRLSCYYLLNTCMTHAQINLRMV